MQNLKFCLQPRILLPSLREMPGFLNCVALNKVPLRNAGHSKWANIKHVKGIKDLQRSKDLTKYHQRILVAIKEFGSPDPKQNNRLASVIQDAKDAKLPMASIQRILDNIAKSKKESKKELWGLKGPGRTLLALELFFESRQKAKDDLNWYLKKGGGHPSHWTDTDISHFFVCTGSILCSQYNGKPVQDENLEDSVEHAIEVGADDVTIQDHLEFGKVLDFTVNPSSFYKVKNTLANSGYTIVQSDIVYIPQTRVEISEEDMKAAETLINKLLECDHVVNVYDNIA